MLRGAALAHREVAMLEIEVALGRMTDVFSEVVQRSTRRRPARRLRPP